MTGDIYLPEVLERLNYHARRGNVEEVIRLIELVKQHARFREVCNKLREAVPS